MLTESILGVDRMYFYFLVGFLVASLASYFKLRVFLNPNYHSGCGCGEESTLDGVFTVSKHKKSAIFMGIPNTVMGMLFYTFMVMLNVFGTVYVTSSVVYLTTLLFTVVSCVGSLYLWYTMIHEVRSVYIICSTIHAVSFLTLVSLL